MRLIDADALLEKKFETIEYAYDVVSEIDIEEAPTIEAKSVKHGEWVITEKQGVTGRKIKFHTATCSMCKKSNGRHRNNYCPNCGAKMDGGNNNEKN